MLAVGLLGGYALAQSGGVVDQGRPGKEGAWPVTIVGSGGGGGTPVTTVPRACTTVLQSAVMVPAASTAVPTSQLASRAWVELCNSAENAQIDSTIQVKCRGDGTAVAFGAQNPGDELAFGQCAVYYAAASVTPHCISSNGDAGVTSIECVP